MATLGQQLKAAREAKGVSEHDAGTETKILKKMIVAMEADDFSGMAAPAYAKGFIRLYARYLGLNPEPLIGEYMAKNASGPKPLIEEESLTEQTRRPAPSFAAARKRFSLKLSPPAWLRIPSFTGRLQPYVVKDIRAAAISASALLALIVLAVSISNCARRHTAEKAAQPPPSATAARRLLDEKLPDLYLVEPGKIESSR